MKKSLAFLMAVLMTLSLYACGINVSLPQDADGNIGIDITQSPAKMLDEPVTADDLVGPWHLDQEKNDLSVIESAWDIFPGYAEWGASMEIRSDGFMSWNIGAVGGSGTYCIEGNVLHTAQFTEEHQEIPLDFVIMGKDELKMTYADMEITWAYGDQEDTEDWKVDFEASLLEQYGVTPDRYEDLGDGIYQVYVTINGESVPYVTVGSATGDYHG